MIYSDSYIQIINISCDESIGLEGVEAVKPDTANHIPAAPDQSAQEALLKDFKPVFTSKDNIMLKKIPDKEEVKRSVWSSNLHAAPGSDGLTTFFYQQCWDVMGDSLTEVSQAIHQGNSPTLSQRTSIMVFGLNPKNLIPLFPVIREESHY